VKLAVSIFATIFVTGCSVVGQSDVETAPYILLKSDQAQLIEVRNYESMVLVSTSMSRESGNSAFRKLFSYITGENKGSNQISMTAPVIINDKNEVKKDAIKGSEISTFTVLITIFSVTFCHTLTGHYPPKVLNTGSYIFIG